MNESRKMALTIAIVMAIGVIALLVEYLIETVGRRWLLLIGAGMIALILLLGIHFAHARDLDGRYAGSPLKEWFDSLRSGKGPCCSDADGTAISDADWRTKDGRYQVRLDVSRVAPTIEMQWIDVPDDAVITEPNRAGKTMVWPLYGYMGVSIRCFMPGSMM